MAVTTVTVADAVLKYGLEADVASETGAIGDVFFATDTYCEYTNTDGGTTWVKTRQSNSAGQVVLALGSGERQTANVLAVETQLTYSVNTGPGTVVHSSTPGVRLFGFVCTVANSAGIDIYDNSAGSGTLIYTADSCAKGDGIRFPGGIKMVTGLTSVLTTDGTINVLWAPAAYV